MRISDWSSDVCSSDLHEGAVELAAFLIEPVAADYRDIAARDVARTDFDDDRRPLLNPAPPFGLRLRAADIEQHAHGFAKGIERLEAGFEVAAIIEDRGIFFIVAQHRQDDELVRDRKRTRLNSRH